MTDQDILDRLNDGSLVVDRDGMFVESRTTPERPWKRLTIISHTAPAAGQTPYRFVTISHKGRKKKISLHRLVWMSVERKVVPDGYDVDHINGKFGNRPDSYANLRLLESSVNQSRGYVSPTPPLPFEDGETPF